MKYFCILMICFTVCSCNNSSSLPIPEKVSIARKIRFNAAKKIASQLHLQPFGSGGAMMYQIDELSLAFTLHKPIDMDEGRRLIVKSVQIFLDEVNSNEDIRPYLTNYPFEPKNTGIQIFVKNKDGSERELDQICIVTNSEKWIKYNSWEPGQRKFGKGIKEPFKEAQALVKMEID